MLRHIIAALTIIVVSVLPSPVRAQAPEGSAVAGYFSRAPIEIMSQIPSYARLDMIDYFNGGSSVKLANRLDAKYSIASLEKDKLVYLDEDSVVTTVAVLPAAKSDTVLMVIRTLPKPVLDSEITLYDTSWQRLDSRTFPRPGFKDWLLPGKKLPDNAVEMPFMLTVADYDADSRVLTFRNVTGDFFTDDDRPAVLGDFRKELKYVWSDKGRAFKKL